MGAKRIVASRQISLCRGVKVAERCGKAVGAVLVRRAARRPQSILQALGQSDEALAPQDDMRMREA